MANWKIQFVAAQNTLCYSMLWLQGLIFLFAVSTSQSMSLPSGAVYYISYSPAVYADSDQILSLNTLSELSIVAQK